MTRQSLCSLLCFSIFAFGTACSLEGDLEVEFDSSKADGLDEVAERIAPVDFRSESLLLDEGRNDVPRMDRVVFRVDLEPRTHASFKLLFSPQSDVVMAIERWDGDTVSPFSMGETDGGSGLRVLAVLPRSTATTYWVSILSPAGLSNASLSMSTEIFTDAASCDDDCRRLLQLPLPDDASLDGYYSGATSVFRNQFGRRDLLMALRHAGRVVASSGYQPFQVEDLSYGDGDHPPGHGSHRRGEDVDIELYSDDGVNVWRNHSYFCTSRNKRCVTGTVRNFDARATALMLGGFYESGRVTLIFLDKALIKEVRKHVDDLVGDGLLSRRAANRIKGSTLQHWANHENHAHLRFRDSSHAVWGEDEDLVDTEFYQVERVFAP